MDADRDFEGEEDLANGFVGEDAGARVLETRQVLEEIVKDEEKAQKKAKKICSAPNKSSTAKSSCRLRSKCNLACRTRKINKATASERQLLCRIWPDSLPRSQAKPFLHTDAVTRNFPSNKPITSSQPLFATSQTSKKSSSSEQAWHPPGNFARDRRGYGEQPQFNGELHPAICVRELKGREHAERGARGPGSHERPSVTSGDADMSRNRLAHILDTSDDYTVHLNKKNASEQNIAPESESIVPETHVRLASLATLASDPTASTPHRRHFRWLASNAAENCL